MYIESVEFTSGRAAVARLRACVNLERKSIFYSNNFGKCVDDNKWMNEIFQEALMICKLYRYKTYVELWVCRHEECSRNSGRRAEENKQ